MSPTALERTDEMTARARMAGVLAHTARWIVPAYGLLFLAFIDDIDPSAEPRIDLTGTLALIAWAFAESGQTLGIVVIATALGIVLITRPGLDGRRRFFELAVMIAMSLLVLYGGKLVNDHLVKPELGVARPNIVQLSELDLLGMDIDSFYGLSEARRSEHLDSIKSESGFGELVMHPEVRDHWVKETAFARPSGHSLASLTIATFYLSMALFVLSGWRRLPFYLLVPWAVCVSLSRPILGVHGPVDIVLGGLAGVVVGALGFMLAQMLLRRHERIEAEALHY